MSAANDNGAKIAYSYKEAVAATGTSRNTCLLYTSPSPRDS
mgnify:CR=1 FL=1